MMWFDLFFQKAVRFLFMIGLISLASCRRDAVDRDQASPNEMGAEHYRADPGTIVSKDLRVRFKTKSDLKNGELIVLMNVENNADKSIAVDYLNCALNIDEERVVVPSFPRTYKSTIAAGEEENYEVHFRPINSIEFYNNTDYYGDMKKRYTFDLNFITDEEGHKLFDERVAFTLSDSIYQDYFNRYAREKFMNVFSLDLDSTFNKKEATYLDKIKFTSKSFDGVENVAPAIYALNPSITINRMIFNVFAYTEKDTLIVNMRMLHEDTHPLKIAPSRCTVNISGVSHDPVTIFSDTFEGGRFPDSTFIFKPGTRLHLKLKYFIPTRFSKWSLSSDWLQVNVETEKKQWDRLLFGDIVFKGSEAKKLAWND